MKFQKLKENSPKRKKKKDEIESAVERTKKTLKRLEKELEQSKTEQKSLGDIQTEIEDWQSRNDKVEKDHERIKNESRTEKLNQKASAGKEDDTSTRNRGKGARAAAGGADTTEADGRAVAREIEDLELALESLKKEYTEKIAHIENKITETNFEENKLTTRANRDETEDINQLKAEIKKN